MMEFQIIVYGALFTCISNWRFWRCKHRKHDNIMDNIFSFTMKVSLFLIICTTLHTEITQTESSRNSSSYLTYKHVSKSPQQLPKSTHPSRIMHSCWITFTSLNHTKQISETRGAFSLHNELMS